MIVKRLVQGDGLGHDAHEFEMGELGCAELPEAREVVFDGLDA